MSNARELIAAINAMAPTAFMDDEAVRANFIEKNSKIRGVSPDEAAMFCEQQAIYYKRVISASWNPNKPDNYLGHCTTFSHYATFMDMAIYGDVLSFNPEDKLVYVELGNYKAGRAASGEDIWEKRAKLVISPYGELAIRMDGGQIKYADPVVIVREGDIFRIGTDDRGNVRAVWESAVTGSNRKIIASFLKLTRPDGSYVTTYLLQDDIDRLAAYSKKKNRGYTNDLYGAGENGQGIDSGFLKAKTIKHSFKTFPKTRLRGTNSMVDEMSEMEEGEELPAGASAGRMAGPSSDHESMLPEEMRPAPKPLAVKPAPSVGADDWDKPILGTASSPAAGPASQPTRVETNQYGEETF